MGVRGERGAHSGTKGWGAPRRMQGGRNGPVPSGAATRASCGPGYHATPPKGPRDHAPSRRGSAPTSPQAQQLRPIGHRRLGRPLPTHSPLGGSPPPGPRSLPRARLREVTRSARQCQPGRGYTAGPGGSGQGGKRGPAEPAPGRKPSHRPRVHGALAGRREGSPGRPHGRSPRRSAVHIGTTQSPTHCPRRLGRAHRRQRGRKTEDEVRGTHENPKLAKEP